MSNETNWLEEERGAVVAFHQANIEKWKAEISELNERISGALYRISELTGTENKYDTGQPLWKKVRFILESHKTAMTTKELAWSIDKFEPHVKIDIKDLISAISATLKPKIDKGDTFNRIEMAGEHYYGLKEWFNEFGDLKIEYINTL